MCYNSNCKELQLKLLEYVGIPAHLPARTEVLCVCGVIFPWLSVGEQTNLTK